MPGEIENTNAQAAASTAAPGAGTTTNDAGQQQDNQQQAGGGQQGEQQQQGQQSAQPEAPTSSLEAVKAAMGEQRKDAAAAATTTNNQQKAAGAQADDGKAHAAAGEGESNWLSREEWDALDQRVRGRITGLVRQRNEVREHYRQFHAAAAPKVAAYNDLNKFIIDIGLNGQQLGGYLELIRQIHKDPAQAWQSIQPTLNYLREHVGEVLPEDLQAEVDDGKISRERAQELAGARRERQRLQHSTQERQQQDQESARRANFERVANENTETIRAWENTWKSNDPDYAKKKDRVWERMVVMLDDERRRQKVALLPRQTVLAIADRAKKDVEAWLADLMPQRREIRPGGSQGNNQNVQANQAPKTSLEAARIGLGFTRAAA